MAPDLTTQPIGDAAPRPELATAPYSPVSNARPSHKGGFVLGLDWVAFNVERSIGLRSATPAEQELSSQLIPALLADYGKVSSWQMGSPGCSTPESAWPQAAPSLTTVSFHEEVVARTRRLGAPRDRGASRYWDAASQIEPPSIN